jgi:hypothetical protein
MAGVVTDPSDEGLPANGLPDNELYLILDVAVGESGSRLQRIGYQANVLVKESDPDLQSLLVSKDGNSFAPEATVELGFQWWFEVTMTGPVPQGQTFRIATQSSDEPDVPTAANSFITGNGTTVTYDFFGGTVSPAIPPSPTVTITAFGKHVMKTATLRLFHLT